MIGSPRADGYRPVASWLLPVIRHQKRKVLGVAAVAVVAALVGEALTTPTYQVHAALLAKFGREYMYRSETGEGVSWAPSSLDRDLNTEVQILAGRDLQERVLATLGIAKVYPHLADDGTAAPQGLARITGPLRALFGLPPRPAPSPVAQALARFDADLVVTGVKDTNVIDVDYRNPDPAVASAVVELLLKYGAEKRTRLYAGAALGTLVVQLAADRDALVKAEAALLQLRQANRLYDADAQLARATQSSLDIEATLAAGTSRIAVLQQAIAATEDRLRKLAGDDRLFTDREADAVRRAEAQLFDLQQQNAALLMVLPQAARVADQRRADEDLLRTELQQQRGNGPDRLSTADQALFRQLADARDDMRRELAQAMAAKDADARALAGARDRLTALLSLRTTLDDLEGRVGIARTIYNAAATKLADLEAAAALDRDGVTNLQILEAPTVPASPVGLRPAARLAIAALLGLLAGLAIGVWSEARRAAARSEPEPSLAPARTALSDHTSL